MLIFYVLLAVLYAFGAAAAWVMCHGMYGGSSREGRIRFKLELIAAFWLAIFIYVCFWVALIILVSMFVLLRSGVMSVYQRHRGTR